MEGITITKRPRLKNPYVICAWPGMGDVAFRAATHLVEKVKAEEFAEVLPQNFFYLTGSVIQDGVLAAPELPYSKFYFWKNKTGKNDLIILISSAQPDLVRAQEYCELIIHFAKSFKAKMVVSFAAMPQPIEHTQNPHVWFAATSHGIKKELAAYDLTQLSEGQISGMNGLFLGIAKRQGLEGFCLLGEIPFYTIQIENPKASHAVLEVLSKILNMQLDLAPLMDQAHSMEGEINKLMEYLKIGAPEGQEPIGEEEIEKIKKSLSQLTKLPVSIKERIENLFSQAKTDLARAHELKAELDKWNVYKEYEDRFLDLFKKTKDKNN